MVIIFFTFNILNQICLQRRKKTIKQQLIFLCNQFNQKLAIMILP